jgi:tripartite-type tricarboxylate transporter receptor subunit TctC
MRDMDVGMWFGVLAPAATQKDIVARLNSEVVKMAAEPAYGKAIVKLGFEPLSSTPDKFSAFMRTELETWGKVIKAAGIKGG